MVHIPRQFRQYEDVFSEEKSHRFPPDRNPNMRIELLPDAPDEMNCKVYPLTRDEREYLKKFLADEVEKKYITPGPSSFTSPVFFIGKKDSKEK